MRTLFSLLPRTLFSLLFLFVLLTLVFSVLLFVIIISLGIIYATIIAWGGTSGVSLYFCICLLLGIIILLSPQLIPYLDLKERLEAFYDVFISQQQFEPDHIYARWGLTKSQIGEMRERKRKSFKHGFILTKEELENICTILEEQIKIGTNPSDIITLTFNLKFKEDAEAEKSSLDEIFKEQNSGEREINGLEIQMINRSHPQSAGISLVSLEFRKKRYASIRYAILGNDKDQIALTCSKINARIKQIKRTPPVAKFGNYLLLVLIWAVIIGLIYLFSWSTLHMIKPDIQLADILFFGFNIIPLFALAITWKCCFPLYNFYWKDYVKFFDNRKQFGTAFSYGIIFVIIINLATGLVDNYYSARIHLGQPPP